MHLYAKGLARNDAHVPGSPAHVPGSPARRTNGLHHCCRLHRGGCNPTPCGGAVDAACEEEEEEEGALLLRALTRSLSLPPPLLSSPPLHSSPFPALCHPLSPSSSLSPSSLSHLFTPCSVRLVGGAHASGIVAAHCSPTEPRLNRRDTAELLLFLPSPPPPLSPFFSFNAITGGIYRMHASPVTCPSMFTPQTASDLPESPLPAHPRHIHPHPRPRSARADPDSTDCH